MIAVSAVTLLFMADGILDDVKFANDNIVEFKKREEPPMPDGFSIPVVPPKPKGKSLSWQERKMGKRR